MILYIENPKNAKKILVDFKMKFISISKHKANTQISTEFLHKNNKLTKNEIKETTAFTIASKEMEYLQKTFLNFIWNQKRPSTAKVILDTKYNLRDNTIPDLKLYWKASLIKSACYWKNNPEY